MNKPSFQKQKIMLRVLYALIPVALAGIYFFGLRVIGILAVSFAFAFATEWIMSSKRKGKISYACFVTASLYALSLPPTTPMWIVASGVIIAILFGKEVFGGFGKNIFNPAIVGRAFVYVSFPVELTAGFVPVFRGWPGGFTKWSHNLDAVTAATPMWAGRDFGFITDIKNLFLGNIGGTFEYAGQTKILAAGSIGELSALIIIISGIYLVLTKTAAWRLMVSTLGGAVILSVFLRYGAGIHAVPAVPFTLLSGALLYAAIFMVTDPISAPKDSLAQWIYGIFIGIMIVFFRYKSIFAGGVAFSILLGNTMAPSLDYWLKRARNRKKAAVANEA